MNPQKRDEIRQRLLKIERDNGGILTPDAVVADAKQEDSPLHDQFQWDVGKAAHAHWVEQARRLITSVKVVETVHKHTVATVFYVRDPRADHDAQGYVSLTTLRSDEDLAREALHAEFVRARAVLARARALAVALDVKKRVDQVDTYLAELVEATKPVAA